MYVVRYMVRLFYMLHTSIHIYLYVYRGCINNMFPSKDQSSISTCKPTGKTLELIGNVPGIKSAGVDL